MQVLQFVAASFLSLALFDVRAQITEAGPDTSLCVNFYTMQGGPLPSGAFGVWTMVSGCGTINNPNDPITQTVNLCVGSNVFEWTVDDGGNITSDIVVITVYNGAMATANAGQDQIIVGPQSSAFLSGTPTPIYPATCQWTIVQGSGNIADPTDPNTMATGLNVGDNIYCWTCDNGPCGTSSDTVTVQMMLINGLSASLGTDRTPLFHDRANERLILLDGGVCDALSITDLAGHRVFHTASASGAKQWSVAGLRPGLYLAKASIGDRDHVLRFVVSH